MAPMSFHAPRQPQGKVCIHSSYLYGMDTYSSQKRSVMLYYLCPTNLVALCDVVTADVPLLEVFKARMDEALSNLIWWVALLPKAGRLELDDL